MFAERDHRARLWTFGAFGVLHDEAHLVADGELVEAAIRDAVAMEVDFVAVGTCNEAAIPIGQETHDPPVVGHRVQLEIPASLANVIFEQPSGSVESARIAT